MKPKFLSGLVDVVGKWAWRGAGQSHTHEHVANPCPCERSAPNARTKSRYASTHRRVSRWVGPTLAEVAAGALAEARASRYSTRRVYVKGLTQNR